MTAPDVTPPVLLTMSHERFAYLVLQTSVIRVYTTPLAAEVWALASALAEAQQEVERLQAEIMSRPTWRHVKDAAEGRLAQMKGERT